jgi:hypothetical protein
MHFYKCVSEMAVTNLITAKHGAATGAGSAFVSILSAFFQANDSSSVYTRQHSPFHHPTTESAR